MIVGEDMSFDINFAFVAFKAALKATPITIVLAFVPFVIGLFFGTLLAISRIYKVKIIGRLSQIYIVVVRGIPIVLILLMSYFIVTVFFDTFAIHFHLKLRAKNINPISIAFIALSISAIAGISEAMRGAILSVGEGQFEAAYSVGLTKTQTLRRIILPQALPTAVPVLCSTFIGLIKGSSLAFLVAVTDLLNAALITANENYKFLEAYVAAAIIYWGLNIAVERISYVLEKSLTAHLKRGVI